VFPADTSSDHFGTRTFPNEKKTTDPNFPAHVGFVRLHLIPTLRFVRSEAREGGHPTTSASSDAYALLKTVMPRWFRRAAPPDADDLFPERETQSSDAMQLSDAMHCGESDFWKTLPP